MPTTMGLGYTLEYWNFEKIKSLNPFERVSGFFLETPSYRHVIETLQNVELQGTSSLNCEAKSKWIHVVRTVTQQGSDVVVTSEQTVDVDRISLAELQSQEFVEFQKKLSACLSTAVVGFRHKNAVAH